MPLAVLLVQFYIKDTKSSNGTFVNESRLSPSGEESGLVELKSRDILQFGVNVNVERRGVLVCVHICINYVCMHSMYACVYYEYIYLTESRVNNKQTTNYLSEKGFSSVF